MTPQPFVTTIMLGNPSDILYIRYDNSILSYNCREQPKTADKCTFGMLYYHANYHAILPYQTYRFYIIFMIYL